MAAGAGDAISLGRLAQEGRAGLSKLGQENGLPRLHRGIGAAAVTTAARVTTCPAFGESGFVGAKLLGGSRKGLVLDRSLTCVALQNLSFLAACLSRNPLWFIQFMYHKL